MSGNLIPHPLSDSFDWNDEVASLPPRDTLVTGTDWERFVSDGFFVAHGLVDPESLAAVISETDRFCEEADKFLEQLPDERLFIAERGAITFAPHIAKRSATLWNLVASSRVADLAHDLVGLGARLYHDQAVYKAPEKPRRFPWHQDNGYGFVTPQHYLTVWIALTDVTVDSGCVWVAPGLHRYGTLKHEYIDPLGWQIFEEPPVASVAAPVAAGDAVVFSSLTPHLTGPNISSAVRKAYIVQYVGPGAVRHEPDGRKIDLDAQCPAIRG
ncbi:MAG: phytanoyl-CoA dioxygenase family protein [Actinobacteria bacterium]|nr:phytanoyl-CoA dioxygenase family protein [Actinomycetota bacterium]